MSSEEEEDSLRVLRDLRGDQDEWAQCEFLYENLSILDAKSASLLQFNSVLLAVLAIFYTRADAGPVRAAALAALFLGLVSSLLCMRIAWVTWIDTEPADQRSAGALMALRNRRTHTYRVAWALAAVAVVGIVAVLGLSIPFPIPTGAARGTP